MDDCLGGCVTFGIVSDRQALYPEKVQLTMEL